MEANRWNKWAEKFANAKMRRISRLVKILGIDSLEEIFGSQATLDILRPLRYQKLCLVRLNKTVGKYQRCPNTGNMKYIIRVPRNKKEAVQFDRENVKSLEANAILKELEALMLMCVFKKLP